MLDRPRRTVLGDLKVVFHRSGNVTKREDACKTTMRKFTVCREPDHLEKKLVAKFSRSAVSPDTLSNEEERVTDIEKLGQI